MGLLLSLEHDCLQDCYQAGLAGPDLV